VAFADARQITAGASLDADVCVVGAGPAGLAVALRLAEAGRRVLVLESGGLSIEPDTADLNRFESDGAPLGRRPTCILT
jgi:choline dehydrogenase-like flavoprotein